MAETNIDNMNGEIFSYIFPKLFDAGALDVFTTPIYMKKSRPASKLSVLCAEENIEAVEKIIFMETTTLGIRKYKVERSELQREIKKVETRFGEIAVKIGYMDGQIAKIAPEYEECAKAAEKTGVALQAVYAEAMMKAWENE